MAHEKTITVEFDGKHYIIPTVVVGKQLTKDEAVDLFRRGQLEHLGVFLTAEAAERAAKK